MEQEFHTASRGECSRNHRDAKQCSEFRIVHIVAALLCLVEHVEGAHHA